MSIRSDNPANRKSAAYLEAFARLISGIGPWLNLEGGLQKSRQYAMNHRQLTLKSLANAV
jgi:hypothetical protein